MVVRRKKSKKKPQPDRLRQLSREEAAREFEESTGISIQHLTSDEPIRPPIPPLETEDIPIGDEITFACSYYQQVSKLPAPLSKHRRAARQQLSKLAAQLEKLVAWPRTSVDCAAREQFVHSVACSVVGDHNMSPRTKPLWQDVRGPYSPDFEGTASVPDGRSGEVGEFLGRLEQGIAYLVRVLKAAPKGAFRSGQRRKIDLERLITSLGSIVVPERRRSSPGAGLLTDKEVALVLIAFDYDRLGSPYRLKNVESTVYDHRYRTE